MAEDVLPTNTNEPTVEPTTEPTVEKKDTGYEILIKLRDELTALLNERLNEFDKKLKTLEKAISIKVGHVDVADGEKNLEEDEKIKEGVVDYTRETVEFVKTGHKPVNNPRNVDNTTFIMKCLAGKATEDEIYRAVRSVLKGGVRV